MKEEISCVHIASKSKMAITTVREDNERVCVYYVVRFAYDSVVCCMQI